MKTNSIQFKFLITIISAMLAITILVGGVSIYEVNRFVRQETEEFIKVTCEKEAAQVNDIFGDMEKSVNIMSGYILDFVNSAEDIRSPETQAEIIRNADRMFADVASYTADSVAYYLRFAPEISDGQTGFFYSKRSGGDEYVLMEPTDISLYDKNDNQRVGWFWKPYEAGKPVWLQPYYNQNNGFMMISYVVPLYSEGQFVGVVGMDFDYTVLNDKVGDIRIYDNGFAHLELGGVPVHFNVNIAVPHASEEYLQVSEELMNGMTLVLSASYRDIRQIRYEIAYQILFTGMFLAAAFCVISVWMVSRIVKPLKKLTDASKKLAEGDYGVEPVCSDTYEIQLLGTAFENMATHLREHERRQYLLAHRDSMTGLRNMTSYNLWVADFENEMQDKKENFGVVMLDLNNLKLTNDQYGHDVGNKLIVAVAKIISDVFKRSPVFRIGGDEFVVILQNKDLKNYEALCKKLDRECAQTYVEAEDRKLPISVARGFALYDPATDEKFVDVFNRADEAMYRHKEIMKSGSAQ